MMKPSTKVQNPPRRGFSITTAAGDRRRHQRVLALDHAARDIIGDGVDNGATSWDSATTMRPKRVSCTKR